MQRGVTCKWDSNPAHDSYVCLVLSSTAYGPIYRFNVYEDALILLS